MNLNKQTILAGYLLILAAVSFWISWWLMPDPGTTDTLHILKIVKEERSAVLTSVIIQIISSVLYIMALFLLIGLYYPQKGIMRGFVLFGIGAMGMCADAFFHLLAWFMTDDTVNIGEDIISVMRFMQTDGLIFLIPLLVPFFIGSIVVAIRLNKHAVISKLPKHTIMMALFVGILGGITGKTHIYSGPNPVLLMLGLFAVGQILIGYEMLQMAQKMNIRYTFPERNPDTQSSPLSTQAFNNLN